MVYYGFHKVGLVDDNDDDVMLVIQKEKEMFS
jgi:hypothetical protein